MNDNRKKRMFLNRNFLNKEKRIRRNNKGVKIGFKHKWDYKTDRWEEVKISPRKWKFKYIQSKKRIGSIAPKGSGFPEGGEIHWKIRADQYAKKVDANNYNLIMVGEKTLANFKDKKNGKWKLPYYSIRTTKKGIENVRRNLEKNGNKCKKPYQIRMGNRKVWKIEYYKEEKKNERD